MGFVWVNAFSFFHCVASPFHSFVTTFHVPFTHSTETFPHWKRVPFAHFTIIVVLRVLSVLYCGTTRLHTGLRLLKVL